MLTSFFNKSRPENTIVILVYMTIGFILVSINSYNGGFSGVYLFKVIGVWALYIFTMLGLNFISQRNKLTGRTSYKILLFSGFTLLFPEALTNPRIVVSGVFIMLALRMIFSLRSGKHMERKIFDASLWIGVSTLVYFWSHITVLVLIVALISYGRNNWRYWLIPGLAFVAVIILTTCYVLYIDEDIDYILGGIQEVSLDFTKYSEIKVLLPVTFVSAFFLWTIGAFIKGSATTSIALRTIYILIFFFAITTLMIVFVASDKNGQEWYFFAIPLSIMASIFFENASSKWIPETLLWIIVLLPFVHYFL